MCEPELSDDKVRQLLHERIEKASRRVAMVAFVRGEQPSPSGVDNNGTASFIQLPSGKFILTNYHVWNTFHDGRANDSTYKLALMGRGFTQPIDLSDAQLISEDRDLDLCVLSYPSERVESLGKEYCNLTDWPPARAMEGDDVSVTGFPGVWRTVEEMLHSDFHEVVPVLRHESVILCLRAEATSTRQIRLRFNNPNPEVVQLSNRPITDYRWGGMSGSLVYRLDQSKNHFVACGILHSAGEGLGATFYATHLDFIQPDGTIRVP